MSISTPQSPSIQPVIAEEVQQLNVSVAREVGRRIGLLQMQKGTTATQVSNDTNTWLSTGLKVSITRTDPASTIWVVVFQNGVGKDTGDTYCGLRLVRNVSTVLKRFGGQPGQDGTTDDNFVGTVSYFYEDSVNALPAMTGLGPFVYETQFISGANTATAYVQGASATTVESVIVALEVLGAS